jgi:hypothetical protein
VTRRRIRRLIVCDVTCAIVTVILRV